MLYTVLTAEQWSGIEYLASLTAQVIESTPKETFEIEPREIENRDAPGFNKLFCATCNQITLHYKPEGKQDAHCSEHRDATYHKAVKDIMEHDTHAEKSPEEEIATIPTLKQLTEAQLKFERQEYFVRSCNGGLDALVEGKTAYEAYGIVNGYIKNLREKLFEIHIHEQTSYVRLLEVKAKLTNEEREKLHIANPVYTTGSINPTNVKPVSSGVKRSPDDKNLLKQAQLFFGPKLTRGNKIASEIVKTHPEYYLNGRVRDEFKAIVEDIFTKGNALSEDMAIEKVRITLRGGKAADITRIASGNAGLNGEEK